MKFTVEEARWHGCRYQLVKPGHERTATWYELETWCKNSFGTAGDPFKPVSCRWYYNNGKFWFRKDSDLSMFMLRWS